MTSMLDAYRLAALIWRASRLRALATAAVVPVLMVVPLVSTIELARMAAILAGRHHLDVAVVVGLLLAIVLQALLQPTLTTLGDALQRRVNTEFFRRVSVAALAVPDVEWLTHEKTQRLLDETNGSASGGVGPGNAASALPRLFVNVGQSFGFVVLLAVTHPVIGLLAFAVWGTFARWAHRRMTGQNAVRAESAAKVRWARYVGSLSLHAGTAPEVLWCDAGDRLRETYLDTSRDALRPVWRVRASAARPAVVLGAFVGSAVALLAMWLVLTASDVRSAALGVQSLFGSVAIVGATGPLRAVVLGLIPLRAMVELERQGHARATTRSSATQLAPRIADDSAALTLSGVRFRYDGASDDAVLVDSLTVRRGEILGIVGPNGAGKTTLLDLCLGLLTPGQGEISLATPTGEPPRLAAVFQSPIRFEGTVRQNVALGIPAPDDALVWDVLATVGLAEMLDATPDGLDTWLSPQYERGTGLSGGQWQRLAWARALYRVRQGADLLALDEPSSNLDVNAEETLIHALLAEPDLPPTLLVTHRVTTLRASTHVLALSAGHVVAQGTHAQLMRRSEYYSRQHRLERTRVHHR